MRQDKLDIFNSSLFLTYQIALEHFKDERQAHEYVRYALIKYLNSGSTEYFPDAQIKQSFIENFTREDVARELADYLNEYMMNHAANTRMEKRLNVDLLNLESEGKTEAQVLDLMRKCLLSQTDRFRSINTSYFQELATRIYEANEIGRMVQEQKKYNATLAQRSHERFGVTNVRTNPRAVNQCREEVLNGTQISIQNGINSNNVRNGRIVQRPRREYVLDGNLFAVTDIGMARSNQEDSVLILQHPANPKIKMLIVADGMGGHATGEKASYEIVKKMTEWFESLNPMFFKEKKKKDLATMWTERLEELDKDIASRFANSGSTFVGAIVGEESTLIASIGDSRAYMVDNNYDLRQMTVDDNIEYRQWQAKWGTTYVQSPSGKTKATIERMLDEKDRVRFSVGSNVITECVGLGGGVAPRFVSMPNNAYRTLMLFSDGVTDCLSDRQIMAITRSTRPSELARAIVDTAITNESYRPDLDNNPRYKTKIAGGKDNTTAAVYTRKQGGDER